MHTEEIRIFNLANTEINRVGVSQWLRDMGGDIDVPTGLTGAEEITAHACKRCYKSHRLGMNPNLTMVRKDWRKTITAAIESGHGSVLEHACYTWGIEGVTRVFTAEMNRHRAGVGVSEGSLRYISFEDIPYWLPSSIRMSDKEISRYAHLRDVEYQLDSEEQREWDYLNAKVETQLIFKKVFKFCQDNYVDAKELWDKLVPVEGGSKEIFTAKKKATSMLRRLIPMGVSTGGVWTVNLRAVRHIISMRADEPAEEEIFWVWTRIAKYMLEKEPTFMGDFEETPEGFWRPKNWKV